MCEVLELRLVKQVRESQKQDGMRKMNGNTFREELGRIEDMKTEE